jgi:hypothetical protein
MPWFPYHALQPGVVVSNFWSNFYSKHLGPDWNKVIKPAPKPKQTVNEVVSNGEQFLVPGRFQEQKEEK